MTTALVSLLSGAPVREDVAMTGEITLRGQVLPVGGIKMKALAARRAGVSTFVLPKRNEADLDDLPEEQREVLLLRLEQELTLEEIAGITGVGRETVKSRLRYAMDKLRARLPT